MLPSVLAPSLPIVWGIAAYIYWHRRVGSPLLFLTAALFGLFGIQAVISLVWDYWPQLMGSYFLEAIRTEAEMRRHLEEVNRVAIIQGALVLICGVPFLWWLQNGLAKRTPNS